MIRSRIDSGAAAGVGGTPSLHTLREHVDMLARLAAQLRAPAEGRSGHRLLESRIRVQVATLVGDITLATPGTDAEALAHVLRPLVASVPPHPELHAALLPLLRVNVVHLVRTRIDEGDRAAIAGLQAAVAHAGAAPDAQTLAHLRRRLSELDAQPMKRENRQQLHELMAVLHEAREAPPARPRHAGPGRPPAGPLPPLPRSTRAGVPATRTHAPDVAGLSAGMGQLALGGPPAAPSEVATPAHRIVRGAKFKLEPRQYADLHLSEGARFSGLNFVSRRGGARRVVMTNSLDSGGFGKFRRGFLGDAGTQTPVEALGMPVGIKELRRHAKRNPDPERTRSYTKAMRSRDMLAEANDTQHLRDIAEQHNARIEGAGSDGALMLLRAKRTPFVVHGVVQVKETKKTHIIMTAEAGSLGHLTTARLHDRVRARLALSVAAQGFTELTALHDDARIAHLDLKPDNVFFNEDGQLKIMDFGLHQALRTSVPETRTVGAVGSIAAPEWFPDAAGRQPAVGAATDVWTLAVVIAEMSCAPGQRQDASGNMDRIPFERPDKWAYDPAGKPHPRTLEAQQQDGRDEMAAFERWRQGLVGADGHIDVRKITRADQTGRFFYRLARDNAPLCALLLEHALVQDPRARMPARELAARCRALVQNEPEVQRMLVSSLQGAAKQLTPETLEEEAEAWYGRAMALGATAARAE